MTYAEWEESVLAANRLEEVVAAFLASKEAVWYLDRHVLDFGKRVPTLEDAGEVDAACRAGLALFRDWDAFAARTRSDAVLVARPVLWIDDDWLQQTTDPTPPHVQTTLAHHPKYFGPHVIRGEEHAKPKAIFDLLAGSGLSWTHCVGSDDGGAWLIWDQE
jgi:hypothetical protein